MPIKRRDFIKMSACASGATLISAGCAGQAELDSTGSDPISRLQPMTGDVVPITDDERRERIEKARKLMRDNGLDAIYMEGGTGMKYFTGVNWWNSERMFGVVIPVKGEIAWVCPAFEEDRARELIRFGNDIRTWEEDEKPARRVAEIFRDRGIRKGKIGIEERVRFFLYDNIRREAPLMEYVSADPVTIGCRVIKSRSELALMQKAADCAFLARFHISTCRGTASPNTMVRLMSER